MEPADVLYPFGYQSETVGVRERRCVFSHHKHMQPTALGSGSFHQKSMPQRKRIRIQYYAADPAARPLLDLERFAIPFECKWAVLHQHDEVWDLDQRIEAPSP